MAYRPNPNDPFITPPPPTDDIPRGADPMYDRVDDAGPVSGSRVALYAVAVLALVGALFYGMSTATNDTASNAPTSTTAQQRPATPAPNTGSGVTTGAARSQPAPAEAPKQ